MAPNSPSPSVTWAPGTGLIDMPIEILREIFINIDGEFSKTLWSLCLTCKLFRNIVEEHCEPEYNLRGKYIEDPYALMEQIKARPHLRTLIRVACMERDFVKFTKHTEEDVRALVSALNLESIGDVMYRELYDELSWENGGPVWLTLLLPHIETIELGTKTSNVECTYIPILDVLQDPRNTNCLRSHQFDRLRNLILVDSAQESIALCPTDRVYVGNIILPSLKVAKLHNVKFDGDEWPEGHSGCSSVEELHVHDNQDVYMYPDLSEHLDTFKILKILHLYIDNSYILYIEEYLERPRYIEILISHAPSLEDLQLYSCEPYCNRDGTLVDMSPHCPSQPSLGHFTNLKSLALTDMSLVGVSTAGPAHWYQSIETTLDHLAKMFPPSLETFKHLLWDGPSVFAKALTKRQQALRCWERVWKASNQSQFPSLQKVMRQNYGIEVLSRESTVIWERRD